MIGLKQQYQKNMLMQEQNWNGNVKKVMNGKQLLNVLNEVFGTASVQKESEFEHLSCLKFIKCICKANLLVGQ